MHDFLIRETFPHEVGQFRAGSSSAKVVLELDEIVGLARSLIRRRAAYGDQLPDAAIHDLMERLAAFLGRCVAVSPFPRVNDIWAHVVLNALVVDCGFWPGMHFDFDTTEASDRYKDAMDAIVNENNPVPLGELILRGWISKREMYRKAGKPSRSR